MRYITGLLFIIIFALSALPARALTYEPWSEDDIDFVLVSGEFKATDNIDDFLEVLASNEVTFVVFDSIGGSPHSAMRHGRIIRALGLSTFQSRDFECASACALAFVGGTFRIATPGSIGVHRSSLSEDAPFDRDSAADVMQELTGDILSYLRDMGVDPELLEISLEYGADDIRYLSGSEMERMRVTLLPDPEDGDTGPVAQGDQQAPERSVQGSSPNQSPHEVRRLARNFVAGIISAHMLGNREALNAVSHHYGDRVDYFGDARSIDFVLSDKRSYFQRWPERIYSIIPGSVAVNCRSTFCSVQGEYDWSVRSTARNRQASGRASFEFRVDRNDEMRITYENGSVLSRN